MKHKLVLIFTTIFMVGCSSHHVTIQNMTSERYEVTKALADDAEANALLAAYKPTIDSIRKPIIGHSALAMTSYRPESLLGNWTADAFLDFANEAGYHADLAIYNLGGIRSTIPEGVITRGNLMDIFPFKNYLSIVTLKGTTLQTLFEQIAAKGGEGVSRGIRMVISSDGKLISATLNGQNINAEKGYRVATINYLANGNDKLKAFSQSIARIDTEHLAFDVVMHIVAATEARGEMLTSSIEGRIIKQH